MKKIKYTLIILAVLIIPKYSSAATVFIDATRKNISVGDTAIVTIKVNSDKTAINSVEGDVSLQSANSAVSVKEFSLAGSIFGMWPRTPSLSVDGNLVSFVGGVPGGFDIQGATLFNIIIQADKEGTVKISPRNIIAFANDGKGTKVPVTFKEITINVGAKKAGDIPNDEWSAVVASDVKPPEDFVVILGKEDSLFEGKKFAFFSAIDETSGISYYDVSENGKPAIRSGSTYVLQDQNASKVKLVVTAYDKAGNKRVVEYTSPTYGLFGLPWAFYIVVLLMILVRYFIKRRKNSRRSTY